jgi:hypothetical protein
MDSLEQSRQIIQSILKDYARDPYAHGDVHLQTVFDPVEDHYLLLVHGWDKGRVHGCLIHVDIIDGKFWIQRDGTERGIANELEAVGVPRDRIVLAFKSAETRRHTGYAIS